jgi:hypothetical protein
MVNVKSRHAKCKIFWPCVLLDTGKSFVEMLELLQYKLKKIRNPHISNID